MKVSSFIFHTKKLTVEFPGFTTLETSKFNVLRCFLAANIFLLVLSKNPSNKVPFVDDMLPKRSDHFCDKKKCLYKRKKKCNFKTIALVALL